MKSKETIRAIIRQELEKHEEISFAYVHGSFNEKETFHDIDIAVYLKELPKSVLQYELNLETKLIQVTSKIVDVRILNCAPLSFRYHVIREGSPILVRNEDEKAEFQEITLSRYFDFAFFRSLYLKETIGFEI